MARTRGRLARCAAPAERRGRGATGDGHVGYYLVDDGLARAGAAVGYRPTPASALYRWALRHPNVVFVGGISRAPSPRSLAVLWLAGPDARAVVAGRARCSRSSRRTRSPSASMNQLITAFLPPRAPAPSSTSRGTAACPTELRTAVVVPTLFGERRGGARGARAPRGAVPGQPGSRTCSSRS